MCEAELSLAVVSKLVVHAFHEIANPSREGARATAHRTRQGWERVSFGTAWGSGWMMKPALRTPGCHHPKGTAQPVEGRQRRS